MPSPSTAPNMASAGPSQDVDIISMRARGRVTVLAGSGAMGGRVRNCGGVVGSAVDAGTTWNCRT